MALTRRGAAAVAAGAVAAGASRGAARAAQAEIALEFVFEAVVTLDPAQILGRTGVGVRRIIPITGGTVKGPALNGTVLPGGADWQVVRDDGMTEIDARYTLKADDGALVYVSNPGIREAPPEIIVRINAGEIVDPSLYYFRTLPRLECSSPKYAWMNRRLFVCRGARLPDRVEMRYYRIT
jgi:hypothetical protein